MYRNRFSRSCTTKNTGSLAYLINYFENIDLFDSKVRCSAEGHVSNILSKRMSSRPNGWSLYGAEVMAAFRAFKYNNESIYDLYTAMPEKEEPELKAVSGMEKTQKEVSTARPLGGRTGNSTDIRQINILSGKQTLEKQIIKERILRI